MFESAKNCPFPSFTESRHGHKKYNHAREKRSYGRKKTISLKIRVSNILRCTQVWDFLSLKSRHCYTITPLWIGDFGTEKIMKLYVFGIVLRFLAKNLFLCMLKNIFVSWDKFLNCYCFLLNSFVSVQNDLLKFYFLGFFQFILKYWNFWF